MFKHDTRNTGQSPYAGPQNNNLKWRYELPNGVVNASPVIGGDGTIYICNSGAVFAVNRDGSLKWQWGNIGGASSSDRALAISSYGTIYAPIGQTLHALNPDGTFKWDYHSDTIFGSSSPSIGADGVVYVGTSNDLLAVKPDGNLFWKYRLGEEVRHSPAIAQDGTIYVRGREDYLVALNTDGSEKWRLTLGSRESHTYASPVIGPDGTIYTFGLSEENLWDNVLYAINPDGSIKWKFDDIGFSVVYFMLLVHLVFFNGHLNVQKGINSVIPRQPSTLMALYILEHGEIICML
jgi:outer membrane protein assembly factor BamB